MESKKTLPRASTPIQMEADISSQIIELSVADVTLDCISNISELDLSEEKNINNNPRDELIKGVMRVYMRHQLTKVAVEDIAKLINRAQGANAKIPENKATIFNEFLSKSDLKVYKYTLCKKCNDYTKSDFKQKGQISCQQCHVSLKATMNFFIYLQVEPQLKRILSDYHQEIASYRNECLNRDTDKIFDVCDGDFMKGLLRKENFCSLTFNTDGAKIHESSQCSLWPLLLICNFLPPRLRFKEKNMIVAGLHYQNDHPDFCKYITPLIEEMNILRNGLIVNSECFKFLITHAALDLPARSKVQCINQYNGYNACPYCENPGEKTSGGVRYTNSSQPYSLRTHKSMILAIQNLRATKIMTNGVKDLSPMIGFQQFDLIKSFTVDYMHAVLLGVVKSLLELWMDSRFHEKPFYITLANKRMINNRISSLKPFRSINRKIGPLSQFKTFKASQFRSFLLYFYPVVDGFLNKKYYSHFALLSSSIYLLLQPEISKDNLHQAEKNLHKFVNDYELFYGKERMTMNVHLITHLIECVKSMGPLWSYSMFSFESYNGTLKKFGNSSVRVVNQIVEKIVTQNIAMETEPIKIAKERSSRLNNAITSFELNVNERLAMQNLSDCQFFASFAHERVIFTSKMYKKATKTLDYFIVTTDKTFGMVKFYFKHKDTNYALIEEYAVTKIIDQFREVNATGTVSVKLAESIEQKFIFMKIGLKQIIVQRPNSFEIN